jgi:sec-independent protein translocase protein TatA
LWIALIVVLMFGTTKLPALGAGLGQSIRNFKKAMSGDDEKPAATPPANDQTPKA